MRDKRWAWIVVYVLATAVLAAGVIVLVNDRRSSGDEAASADELPDLAPMPFAADLSVAGTPTGTIGTHVSLSATGYSEDGVASVDLYDGARRVATVIPQSGSASVPLDYPALTMGPHLLHAQVTDEKGKQSLTAPVSVDVHAAQGTQNAVVTVTPDEGETPEELAARLGVDPKLVAAFPPGAEGTDPQVPPTDPMPEGTDVTIIVPADNGAEALEPKEPVVTNPEGAATPTVDAPEDPMTLTAKGSDCAITLTAKGSDGPVFYFDQNAGVPGWASVGETDGDGSLELPAQDPGVHVFFARTDTKKTEPVSVTVPFACADDTGWTGNATLIDGILRAPAATKPWTYFLLSVEGAPWQRVPAEQSAALGPQAVKDVAQYLPAVAGKHLELEVWERDEYLSNKIGSGTLQVPDGRTLTDVIGEPSALRLSVKGGSPAGSIVDYALDDQDDTLTFKWQAASSRVDEVMWQVLSRDAATSDTDLTPPTLIAAGTSKRSTEDDTGLGGAGSFQIDTADIPGHEPPNPDVPGSTPVPGVPAITALRPAVTPGTIASLGKGSFAAPVDTLDATQLWQLPLDLPGEGDEVFVRVVANPKGPAVAAASPTLTVRLPVAESTKGFGTITMTVDSTKLTLGRAPNPTLVNCVDITVPWTDPRLDPTPPPNFGNPFADTSANGGYVSAPLGESNPIPSMTAEDRQFLQILSLKAFYPVSGTYCLSDFPPPPAKCSSVLCDLYYGAVEVFEFAGGIVGQLYDLAAYAYNGVIKGVVFAIANLNPVCLALKEASEKAGKSCVGTVGIAASSVISAVLAAYGLPPSLPDRGQLVELAQGNIEVIAVEIMKQAGIPCDDIASSPAFAESMDAAAKELGVTDGGDAKSIEDPCTAMAHLLVSTARGQIESAAATTVSQASGLPNGAGIDGFKMVPSEKGVGQPAKLEVTMHPTKANADGTGAICNVEVRDSPFGLKDQPHLYELYAKLLVREDAPIDGHGSWSGTVYLKPSTISNYGAVAQNAPVTIYGRRQFPSQCKHADLSASGVIPPYEPR